MKKKGYLLSVVAGKEADVVNVHADVVGLTALITALEQLRSRLASGDCEHDHFLSEEWGGSGLTASMLASDREAGAQQVHHLKLYAWTPEWKQKHGL